MPIRELSKDDEVLPIREVKPDEQIIPVGAEPQKKESTGIIPQWLKSAAIPTALSVGGGAAGAATPIPGGAIAGEMLGGGLGEKINQWMGITEPSNTAVVGSAAAAPIGRLAGFAGRGLLNTVGKTFAGRDIMSEAAESLLKKMMTPTPSAADLFKQADALRFFVPAIKTPQAIDNILIKEINRAPTAIRDEILNAIGPLKKYFVPSRGTINAIGATELMEEEQRMRLLASRAFDEGNSKLGNAINSVRVAMLDDLEQSGAGVVKQASRAYRKEMALDDLSKLLGKPHPVQKISDFTKDNPMFRGVFSEPELAQINRIAKKLSSVPASGGSGIWGKTITGVTGAEMAGPVGAVVGFLGPDAIKAILGSPFGRGFAERILSSSPTLDHNTLAALSVFAKGMMAQRPQSEQNQ